MYIQHWCYNVQLIYIIVVAAPPLCCAQENWCADAHSLGYSPSNVNANILQAGRSLEEQHTHPNEVPNQISDQDALSLKEEQGVALVVSNKQQGGASRRHVIV